MRYLAADFNTGMRQKSGNLIKDWENIWKLSKYYLDSKDSLDFQFHMTILS